MLADAARAAIELALARLRLRSTISRPAATSGTLSVEQNKLVDRIAFVIPRIAARVPWRADCLVQATAAEHWLKRRGIASSLHFGVPKQKGADFEPHAWLTVGERVVTGGDISGYTPLRR